MSRKSIWSLFRNGQDYMTTWPMRKELAPMFPEPRYIKATQFAIRVMPAVAVISVLSQMVFHNYDAIPQAMIVALFALSMPLQGLLWLGRRSRTDLPPSLATWYRELHEKLESEGNAMEPVKAKPRYVELAQVLNSAFKQLDSTSLERWF
ncbi:terminus macrodomain insulation protein YfbV [Photobacterium kagoshimensis]|uniref:terminus macrodomain insulation protein YfbV n=1 Tax=Photobacterium kagoshimensis TaxID=2910242 RepID=UPI003D0C9319